MQIEVDAVGIGDSRGLVLNLVLQVDGDPRVHRRGPVTHIRDQRQRTMVFLCGSAHRAREYRLSFCPIRRSFHHRELALRGNNRRVRSRTRYSLPGLEVCQLVTASRATSETPRTVHHR